MKKNAFTLVELIGVIVILAAIALLAFPPLINQIQKSQGKIDENTKKIIVNSAQLYVDDNLDTYIKSTENTYCLPITTLIESGKLGKGFIDANENITKDYMVEIKYSNNNFSYDVLKDCEENYLCKLSVDNDNDKQLDVGDEVTCGTESFYVIPNNDGSIISNYNTIDMLAKYRMDLTTKIQNTSVENLETNHVKNFSLTTYWLDDTEKVLNNYKPAGSSRFVYIYDSSKNNPATVIYYVDEYANQLKTKGVVTSTTKLMSYEQADLLGCKYDSSISGYGTCGPAFPNDNIPELSVKASDWVWNVSYWLGSYGGKNGKGEKRIWSIDIDGSFDVPAYQDQVIYHGVRPVVTISKNEIKVD